MDLFPYFCPKWKLGFAEPTSDGRCPHCGDRNWKGRKKYYEKKRAERKAKEDLNRIIQRKLEKAQQKGGS